MRIVTAEAASRSLDVLLDEVERGDTVLITRGGKRVAMMRPVTRGSAADVLALLTPGVDEDSAADVAAAREAILPWRVEGHLA